MWVLMDWFFNGWILVEWEMEGQLNDNWTESMDEWTTLDEIRWIGEDKWLWILTKEQQITMI
jgi:hypothetical protein